ncbi:MAG: hypothetical protein NTV86_23085 [Planctomycetota bacterium]|nr:hypothetical protein [Planctomycetota bacterium]
MEDHCAGVDFLLRNGAAGQAYNLGAGHEISGVKVADRILALLGKSASLKAFVTDRPGHDYRYSVDMAIGRLGSLACGATRLVERAKVSATA